jgi:hypothetical protein
VPVPDLNVRGVPTDVHTLLREEAEETHRSVTSLVISALQEYAERLRKRRRLARVRRSVDALRDRIARRSGLTSDTTLLIRQDRAR